MIVCRVSLRQSMGIVCKFNRQFTFLSHFKLLNVVMGMIIDISSLVTDVFDVFSRWSTTLRFSCLFIFFSNLLTEKQYNHNNNKQFPFFQHTCGVCVQTCVINNQLFCSTWIFHYIFSEYQTCLHFVIELKHSVLNMT